MFLKELFEDDALSPGLIYGTKAQNASPIFLVGKELKSVLERRTISIMYFLIRQQKGIQRIGDFPIKAIFSGKHNMRLFFLCMVLVLCILSCTSTKNADTIVVISEEIIQEFRDNEKDAIKKYKHKIFQISGENFEVSTPEGPDTFFHRNAAASGIGFKEGGGSFSFNFDYDVLVQYPQLKEFHRVPIHMQTKDGVRVTVQGSFEDFSKRMITVYDNEKKKAGEKYWEEVEWCFFSFKKSKVVDIVSVN